mgnify:CR=1 FL=1
MKTKINKETEFKGTAISDALRTHAKHTPGAYKIADILLNGDDTLDTSWGRKTSEGLAGIIDREHGQSHPVAGMCFRKEHEAFDALLKAAKAARDSYDAGIVALDWLPDSPLRKAIAKAIGA